MIELIEANSAVIITAVAIGYVLIAHGPEFFAWISGRAADLDLYEKIKPFAMSAIIKAYKVSEATVDTGQARLLGADKLQMAIDLYTELPGPISMLISIEEWEGMVKQVFSSLNGQIDAGQDWIEAQADSFQL